MYITHLAFYNNRQYKIDCDLENKRLLFLLLLLLYIWKINIKNIGRGELFGLKSELDGPSPIFNENFPSIKCQSFFILYKRKIILLMIPLNIHVP